MLNKKMILSVLIIGCIATVTSAGTYAYFNDVETADDNTVTAGTLYLNDASFATANLNVTNAQPGDILQTVGTINIQNLGSLPGTAVAEITGVDGADLSKYLYIYITDTNGNNKMLYNGPASGATAVVALGDLVANGGNYAATVRYSFPNNGDQNDAQGDIFKFNIKVTLNQDV